GSSPSLPDGSNPSAAIVQSASDVQCSRLLKTTRASGLGISRFPVTFLIPKSE
ncbi:MAG: restriction endonuclease, partial [Pseudomonas kuykendallii]